MLWLCELGILLLISQVFAEENGLFNFKFHQNDYNVKIEWAEVARYNKNCCKQFQLATFKFNRTCTAFNLTFNTNWNLGKDLEIVVQVYKFASNEYRQFPIRFEVNYCTGIAKNLMGARRAFKCGNFTGCPVLKHRGVHVCNFTPDPSELPPYIPNGRCKLEFQGLYHDEEVFVLNGYIEVHRPFKEK